MPIALPDSRKVKLSELADISDSHAEVRSLTRLNGREVLGFNVFRAKGSSDTVVAENVQSTLNEIKKEYPNIQIDEVYNSVDATQENYSNPHKALYGVAPPRRTNAYCLRRRALYRTL